MKQLLAIAFITLMALGMGCAWISPASETTSSDGIQVHGHWTVTVTNPDGSVDAVHEFDNALTNYGKSALSSLITGSGEINFFYSIASVPDSSTANDWHCLESIDPSSSSWRRYGVSPTTLTRDESVGNPVRVTAICTASGSGSIEEVNIVSKVVQGKTFDFYRDSTNPPGNYTLTSQFPTTEVVLNPPISVETNQVIAYNYTISFE